MIALSPATAVLRFMLKIHMSGNSGEVPIGLDLPWMSHIWLPVHERLTGRLICCLLWTDRVGFLLCTTCNHGHASKAKWGYFTYPIWQPSNALCLCIPGHQEHFFTWSHWRPKAMRSRDPGWILVIEAKWKVKRVWDCMGDCEAEILWSLFSSWVRRMPSDAEAAEQASLGRWEFVHLFPGLSHILHVKHEVTRVDTRSWPGDPRNRCLEA